MAFPQVASVGTSSETAATTTHDVVMPSGIVAGDLLLAVLFADHEDAPSLAASGFTSVVLSSLSIDPDQDVAISAWAKIAVGGEANTSFTTPTAVESHSRVYRITGAHASTLPEGTGDNSVGAAGAANPPSLNPAGWGTEDTLWFTAATYNTSVTLAGYPTGYGLYQNTGDTGGTDGITWGIAGKENAAASEDPGTGFGDSGVDWAAITIAIRPAAAVPPPDQLPAQEGNWAVSLSYQSRKRFSTGRGGTFLEYFEPSYSDPETVTADKFWPEYPVYLRRKAWRPEGCLALTEVSVPADVVEHGWDFGLTQIQRRWKEHRSRLFAPFSVPQQQDPTTLMAITIIGRSKIIPSYKGLSGIRPTYKGESELNSEGE